MYLVMTEEGVKTVPEANLTMQEKKQILSKVETKFSREGGAEYAESIQSWQLCRRCLEMPKAARAIYCLSCIHDIAMLEKNGGGKSFAFNQGFLFLKLFVICAVVFAIIIGLIAYFTKP